MPLRAFTMAQIRALPARSELLLVNASRQATDYYATYRGVRVRDLLAAAGVDPDAGGFAGVTVIAPDGYLKDLPARQVNAPFPAGLFVGGLDSAALGADCGFVQYPRPLPAGLRDGARIPGEPWMLLAYERDGGPMDVVSLDPATGRIRGEGPFRLVVPQSTPGTPDRGSGARAEACADGHPVRSRRRPQRRSDGPRRDRDPRQSVAGGRRGLRPPQRRLGVRGERGRRGVRLRRAGAATGAQVREDGARLAAFLDCGEDTDVLLARWNDDYRRMGLTMGGVADCLALTLALEE